MIDLIGRPYRWDADGTDPDGALDCINLVFTALDRLGLSHPERRQEWYNGKSFARDLLTWCRRVKQPEYDGDVLLLPQETTAFAVYWENGCLYINQHLKAVAWCPIGAVPNYRCFRLRSV
jgi:cell wall-associated NlpC family hydrolase